MKKVLLVLFLSAATSEATTGGDYTCGICENGGENSAIYYTSPQERFQQKGVKDARTSKSINEFRRSNQEFAGNSPYIWFRNSSISSVVDRRSRTAWSGDIY